MAVLYTNNAATDIVSALSNSATSISVISGDGALFPNPTNGDYFLATLQDQFTASIIEIVKVTARSGDTMTFVRAQEGTTAQSFASGSRFELRITAGVMNTAAAGGTSNGVVYENGQTITSNYIMTTSKNGLSVGPVAVASGVSVTIPSGSRWVVL